jgi:hypothetical protein
MDAQRLGTVPLVTPKPDPEPDERLVREEEEAAAEEAGAIGGRSPDEGLDPSERPLREAGEGESEGFEEAERELIEHASHGDPSPYPGDLAGKPEDGRVHPEYGEADHEKSSERNGEDEDEDG